MTRSPEQKSPRRLPPISAPMWVLSLAYISASTLGIIPFTIWPSVEDYLGRLDPYLYFQKSLPDIVSQPWGIRSGIAIPSLLLAEHTPLSQEQSFGLFCGVCLVVTAVLIYRTAMACFLPASRNYELYTFGLIFCLGYFMNGRLCAAFLASALLMQGHLLWINHLRSTRRTILTNLLSLPLLTVSSGTFLVGFATICVWTVFAVYDLRAGVRRIRCRPVVILAMAPVLGMAWYQTSVFTSKLSRFYRGDLTQVLHHGYGRYIENYIPGLTANEVLAGLTVLVPVVLVLLLLMLNHSSWSKVYIQAAVLVSISLGVCGYSTLLTNTPTMILYSLFLLHQQRLRLRGRERRVLVLQAKTPPTAQFFASNRGSG